MSHREVHAGRALDRLVGLSDGVVAVAITLLALPLLGIEAPPADQSFLAMFEVNAVPVITFIVTFLLVAGLWRVHNRITNLMHGYDTGSFWINTLWLAGIVVLPWASSLAGERWQDGKWAGGPSALFYWLVIAFISAMATAMRFYVHSHRDLIETDSTETWDAQIALGARRRGVILSVGFAVIGVGWFWSIFLGIAIAVALFVVLICVRRSTGVVE
ncbi:MAG: TMEM175 family protein [Candidatus Nanopelagicales bacterium]